MATLPYSAVLAYGAVGFNEAIGKTTSRTLDTSLRGRAGMWALAGIAPALPGRSSMPIRATTPNGYTKTISGTVTSAGSPVVGAVVRCYLLSTGREVGETLTSGTGTYAFGGLEPATKYDVLCEPPDPTFNKMVLTRVETTA